MMRVTHFLLNAEAELVHTPLFHLARALHFIDVHANFVSDIRRRLVGVRRKVFKDNSGPVRIILQKLQCFAQQVAFSGDRHKLIQVRTLSTEVSQEKKRDKNRVRLADRMVDVHLAKCVT